MTARLLHWCATVWQPDGMTWDEVMSNGPDPSDCTYISYGFEVCPKTGTEHCHVYVQFKEQLRMSTLKNRYYHSTTHWEARKGTPYMAAQYVAKDPYEWDDANHCPLEHPDHWRDDDGFCEVGPRPSRAAGEKSGYDWDAIYDMAKLNPDDEQIPKYVRFMYPEKLRSVYQNHVGRKLDLPEPPHCFWHYGDPHTGKTEYVKRHYEDVYKKTKADLNFNGYRGQMTMWIEELDQHATPAFFVALKEWCDRGAFQARVLYGNIEGVRPHTIVVSSQQPPQDCMPRREDSLALARRFKVYHHYRDDDGRYRFKTVSAPQPAEEYQEPICDD